MLVRPQICFGAIALFSAIAACSSSSAPPVAAGSVSSSIAISSDKNRLFVVNPDQGSISIVDAKSLALIATVDVGAEPHALLVHDEKLLVTTSRGGELVVVDPASASVEKRAPICNGPGGFGASPDGTWIAVACEWDGSVVRVDPESLATSVLGSHLARPRAVAVVGNGNSPSAFVTEFTGGNVVRIAGAAAPSPISLVPNRASYRPALSQMTANLAATLVPIKGNLLVAYELVNHTGDTSLEKIADDYGSVSDGNPKINPAIASLHVAADGTPSLGDDTVLFAVFDGGARVFNGPVALAATAGHYVLVANVSSNNVAVIDTDISDPSSRAVGNYAVGAGPSGIAVDEAAGIAYIDNAFDGSISKIDLSRKTTLQRGGIEPIQTQIRALQQPFSASARAGRKLFYDASNTHVTPSGVVACASCHPGGEDDGLVWFIRTANIPLKRRRTPSLANAHTATAPYHWNGQYAALSGLAQATITDLMAGDGLLVDLAAVQAYVDEMVQAPLAPRGDAAAIARGKMLFESADTQCATCHSGADFTDDELHAVLSPMSLSADDTFTMANTPALHALFLRAPYFHDGRSPSLRDLLTRSDAAAHGKTSQLAAGDVDDLVAYLMSL